MYNIYDWYNRRSNGSISFMPEFDDRFARQNPQPKF